MPSETLQLHYPAIPRINRRRPKPLTLRQTIARLVLLLVGLVILIAILIKLGVFEDPERKVYMASGIPAAPVFTQHTTPGFKLSRFHLWLLAFSFSLVLSSLDPATTHV